jgi:TetR/AcrR family transcriptional regulator, regulator of cefoperazone and chloramphenicol sensitivity
MARPDLLPSPRAEATRAALTRSALELFGAKGFEATSTREIASAAGANIASIAYHFGGKEGLRAGCADFVVATIGEVFARTSGGTTEVETLAPEQARDRLAGVAGALIDALIARDDARPIARFVLREMFEPSAAFERLYLGAMAPMHTRACAIWSRAAGASAESEATRLAVFALIAQVVYFRLARPAILRRMNWSDIGAPEAAGIKRVILGNLDAAIAHVRGSKT